MTIEQVLKTSLEFLPKWQISIYKTIQDWYSSSDYIEVKTSGSTGQPKIIQLAKKYIKVSAENTANYLNLKNQVQALNFLPAEYIGGRMMLFRSLHLGWTLDCLEPKTTLPALNRKYDFTALTPSQFLNSIQAGIYPNAIAEKIILGGAPISQELNSLIQDFDGAVYHTFGMTETYSHVAMKRINSIHATSSFHALPNITFSTNANSQLIIHAPQLGINELLTNDIVELIDSQTFIWLGRLDGIINSGGLKIIPEKLESILSQELPFHFYISKLNDSTFGERPILHIEGRQENVDINSVQNICINKFGKNECPIGIAFFDKFIQTDSGKIKRQPTENAHSIVRWK